MISHGINSAWKMLITEGLIYGDDRRPNFDCLAHSTLLLPPHSKDTPQLDIKVALRQSPFNSAIRSCLTLELENFASSPKNFDYRFKIHP